MHPWLLNFRENEGRKKEAKTCRSTNNSKLGKKILLKEQNITINTWFNSNLFDSIFSRIITERFHCHPFNLKRFPVKHELVSIEEVTRKSKRKSEALFTILHNLRKAIKRVRTSLPNFKPVFAFNSPSTPSLVIFKTLTAFSTQTSAHFRLSLQEEAQEEAQHQRSSLQNKRSLNVLSLK